MSPQEFAMLDAQAHQYYDQTHPPTNTAQAKPKASGNFLTHLLPTVGGTGGAIGGAAIGTALLPGIGTLAGALLGGALGGGASKVGENAIEHQKLGSGVAGQAIEQGVLGAGPLRLAKAATFGTKAAVDAAKAGGGLEEALNAANQVIRKPATNIAKNLVTQGEAAQGRVAGVSAGSKVAGKELTPQDTKAMLQTLQQEGIKTGNANNTLRDIQDKLNTYGQGIGEHFTNNNAPLVAKDVKGLASEYIKGLKTSDPTINKQAQVLATDLQNNVKDTKGLWEFRKNLDSMIPDAKQGADNTGAAKLIALKNMRQFITGKLGDVPGASNYHNLSEIKPFISAEAKRLNNPGGGIIGRVAASGPVQKVEQLAGKATAKAGNALSGASDATSAGIPGLTPGAIASRTVPFGALSAAGSGLSQPATAADTSQPGQSQQPQDLTSALMGAQGLGQDAQAQQPASSNPYSQENLMADIQRDPKHADQYISTYASLDKIFNPPSTTKPLNSTQQQQAFNAQSGLDSLGEIANVLQQNPNAAKLASIPGGSLAANLTHTGSYQAAINNATDVIGRLRSGGAIGQQEEIQFKKLLPAFGDNPDTINYKLQQLSHVFQQFANPQASQPGSTDLTSALMQAGYGQ